MGVLAGRGGAPARASLPGEIVLTSRELLRLRASAPRRRGDVDVVCPADLDVDLIENVLRRNAGAFEAVRRAGPGRVGFFVHLQGELVVNELNTMPGFTPISMFPKCWIATGLSYGELITELIETDTSER